MEEIMNNILSSREKKIIIIIISSNEGITIKSIAEEIGVSRRTILREITTVYEWFSSHGFTVQRNTKKGLNVKLDIGDKERLLSLLEETDIIKLYSKNERQMFILTELLQAKDALNLYYFASVLSVSEATISHDLNKIQEWLLDYDLILERKQGLGVLVNGRERSKRKALINILYELLDGEQLKDVVTKQIGLSTEYSKTSKDIRKRLLDMIDFRTIKIIEQAISSSENEMGFKFAESSYTALAVHLALAVQRIKNGERIIMNSDILNDIKLFDEYVIAAKLIQTLSRYIEQDIPEDEIGYVTMHLKGARYKNGIYDTSVLRFNELIISNYQLTAMINKMIKIAERETGYELKKSDSLLIGLVDHLRPAINRLQMKLEIRNPLLKKIKEEYPHIFEVSILCSEVINDHLGFELPESEIGYIAMHIGSAIEQIKNSMVKDRIVYNIVVTCTSGIGTSKMLAERIKNEFNNINIIEVFATTNLSDKWLVRNDIDLIVSTVHFVNEIVPVISVNPLLLDKDIDKINQKLSSLIIMRMEKKNIDEVSLKDKVKRLSEYSLAIVELLENFIVQSMLEIHHYEDFLTHVASQNKKGSDVLLQEIKLREQLGSIIFQEEKVIFLHTRSEVVDEISIGIFRNKFNIQCGENLFNTALVLLAPKNVSKEKLEVIGEISSRVVSEEDFLKDLRYDTEEELYTKIEGYLSQFFHRKNI